MYEFVSESARFAPLRFAGLRSAAKLQESCAQRMKSPPGKAEEV
jgi:hypothetical protein